VTRPEDALAAARAAAEERRRGGGYEEPAVVDELGEQVAEYASPEVLREWAFIELDAGSLYSTRRFGAPITWTKRFVLRALRQYLTELEARQTRFNVAVLARLELLEQRLAELERKPE
jgi:hypothetical protein